MNIIFNIKRVTTLGLIFVSLNTAIVSAASVGMVISDDVNIRSSNSTEATVISKASNGETISILSDLDGWFKISSPSTGEAYVTSQFVKVTEAEGTVNSVAVNIRTSPSTDADIVGQASVGDLLSVKGANGDWYEVVYNGKNAYVRKDFVNGNMLKYVPTNSVSSSNNKTENIYAMVSSINGLNMRESASTSSQVLKALDNGTTLNVHDVTNGWVKVSDDDGTVGYVSSDYVTLNNGTKPDSISTSSKGKEIITYAKQFLGTPYVYGGTSLTSGVDCSGFVYSVFKNFGITLSRNSRSQLSDGTQISKSSLQAGDLVFFNTGGNSSISHVGIYMGDGNYIHSTDGGNKGVTITSLSSSYSARTYVSACRILK